jgi:predicted RNA-binding protein with TRAM domain
MPRFVHAAAFLALLFASAAALSQAPAGAIAWRPSLTDAATLLRAPGNSLPCAVYLFSADSRREQEMEANVWSSPSLRDVAPRAIWAKADVSEPDNRSFAKGRNVLRVPCVLLLNAKGEELGRLQAEEITAAAVANLIRLHAPAPATPAPAFTPAPVAPPPQAGERPTIIGWTVVESVDARGVGRGVFRGKPIAIEGVSHTLAGQWVYFHDLRDQGAYFAAKFAPPPTIMTEPPTGDDGRSRYEVGQWYDTVIVEPAQRRPGSGVARLRGMVTFVPDAQTGERVIIEIETVNDRWLASRLVYKFPPQQGAPAGR